jgi:predicted nucleotidyltransferase
MPTINSQEPDLELAQRIAEERTIIRAPVGSTLHGLHNPGTDDRDEMGVCVEPAEYVIGLRDFEHFVYRTQPEGVQSGPGDLDLTIYGLRKYCRLALKGSPTTLLLLFVPRELLLVRTDLGDELQALAPAFVCRRTGQAFLGYLDAQRRGLVGDRHAPRTRERSEEHGYDTKYAMHALRIGYQGQELLSTGQITVPVPEPARSRLMQVRAGSIPMDVVLEQLDEAVAQLQRVTQSAHLPDAADNTAVNSFLTRAYQAIWSGHGAQERASS